jgi:phosphoribosylformimino-5-aminoimidazole carboxamide ribotide isomerase
VDLDAALDRGDNLALVERIAAEAPGDLQVGGGIRDEDRAQALLEAGADRVIVGTRAVEDRAWLAALADRFPGCVVVAADVRDGQVLRRGWREATDFEIGQFLDSVAEIPLAGVLCTDVGREGRVQGVDRAGIAAVVAATQHSVWISGGVSTVEELRYLKEVGAEGAVLGMALYTGALDADAVAEEFGR